MPPIAVLKGTPQEMVVCGNCKEVTPFVGIDVPGQFSKMGIGLRIEATGEHVYWGLVIPHHILATWRAMKLLETLDTADPEILAACIFAVRRPERAHEIPHVLRVSRQLGGIDAFENVRKQLLLSLPEPSSLERALMVLKAHEVPVDADEFHELPSGHMTTAVKSLMAAHARTARRYRKRHPWLRGWLGKSSI
jgi:hypothetical protein